MSTDITNKDSVCLLVVSDTHGTMNLFNKILEKYSLNSFSHLIHLGDNYSDIQEVIDQNMIHSERVPGTRCPEYSNRYIDNRKFIDILDWKICISHTPTVDSADLINDPDPDRIINQAQCDVFMHGHTHAPRLQSVEKTLVMNPGHLCEGDRRGHLPSYGICTITSSRFEISIFKLDGHSLIGNWSCEK